MNQESELERKSEIADAQLGVAEDLAWPISTLSGMLAKHYADSWLVAIVIALGVLFLVIYPYRKRADQCEDEYFKLAKLGKYYQPVDSAKN